MSFVVALAQMAPRFADVRGNVDRHLEIIEEASNKHADILLFPELSLTGRALGDLAVDVALTLDSTLFADIRRSSKQMAIGIGLIERASDRVLRNSYLYLDGGTIISLHRKLHLEPTPAGHESELLSRGRRLRSFDTRRGRFGILTGADGRHVASAGVLALDGMDALILPQAIPARPNAEPTPAEELELWPRTLAMLTRSYVFAINRTGVEEGWAYPGGTRGYGPTGKLLAEAEDDQDALVICSLDHENIRRARVNVTGPRDEARDVVFREMKRVARDS